jgi:hypothetical protein
VARPSRIPILRSGRSTPGAAVGSKLCPCSCHERNNQRNAKKNCLCSCHKH